MFAFVKCLSLSFLITFSLSSWAAPMHIGSISPADLLTNYEEFSKEYESFEVSEQDIKDMQKLAGKSVLVLMGTWCHDSKREVGRFLKLLDASKVELAKLELVGVDFDKKDDKHLSEKFALQYTPTFIILADGDEIHRVIEKPQGTLAHDLTSF
ncbi:TlpA family protein disulfide reductase [Pseudoalteromonas sp. SSDWG2]|uniref:TlpA family protein disulfide reductase n=1 Tax=Pseudoalteromonas sp. SSDWG2 TaxID=3139391 RepID=UPI003BA9CEB5